MINSFFIFNYYQLYDIRYLFERGVHKAMPEVRVGAKRKDRNFVKNNTTYEEVHVYCSKTNSYVTRRRPVRSDVRIRPKNLDQGTSTDETVRRLSKEENEASPYINQAGHLVPKAAGGSGTNPDNIFIQDKYINNSINKRFDNIFISILRNDPNSRIRLIHKLEYDNELSSTKAIRVIKTARDYTLGENGKLIKRGFIKIN